MMREMDRVKGKVGLGYRVIFACDASTPMSLVD